MTDTTSPAAASPDPVELLRSRRYLGLVVFGAIVGVLVAVVAYFFLKAVGEAQHYIFTTLPGEVGYDAEPAWWPAPWLDAERSAGRRRRSSTCRARRATSRQKGSRRAGRSPRSSCRGSSSRRSRRSRLGVVLGPEAPLIAIGSGLGVLALHLAKKGAPAQATAVLAAAGSFAAISTLLGSPLAGAFLLLEAAGLGGPLLGVVLVPGLLAAGIGALIFVGLDSWTGFGTFSLAIPNIPHFGSPTGAEFLWAIAIGVAGAVLGGGIRRLALLLQSIVERRMLLLMPLVGLAIGGLAIAFQEWSSHPSSEVLFSGQDALPGLIEGAAGWTVGALILLVACKGLAYSASLSSFRGGPVFPGMFIGAAGGLALSHLPGLPEIAGVAMGIGAMTVAMLNLPFTSVLLVSLFLQADAVALMPLVIVAVVVSYIASARITAPKKHDVPPNGPAPA